MNNAEQPGRLRLERAAAEASARAEHSTVVGRLLYFCVCCELAVCRPRALKRATSRFQSAEIVLSKKKTAKAIFWDNARFLGFGRSFKKGQLKVPTPELHRCAHLR